MHKQKVIFLYGLKGNKRHARTAQKTLKEYEVISFNYNSDFKQPIQEIARELKRFIDSITSKKEKVNLIGISAGGVIASYYQKFIAPAKVNKLVTLSSPLKGTYITGFYSKRAIGVKQMAKNSSFLDKLNSKKSKSNVLNFYCYFDILVPGNSGKGENPVPIPNFLHFFVQYDKRILNKIKEFFDK